MLGADPDIGNTALRLWMAAGSASLLFVICALAFDWTNTSGVRRIVVVLVGAFLGGTLAWTILDTSAARDRSAERRALATRAAELTAPSLAPGSPLACLNGFAGDDVEAACEKALFAAPATVAAATSYAAARVALLGDMVAYSKRGGNIDDMLVPLRRSLETDRFGFVAHALAMGAGCTSENCRALALLHDPTRVRANLRGQTLDRYLDRYAAAWAQAPEGPLADGSPPAAGQSAAGAHKVVDIDFPSAASIPAISIMNPEPKAPPAAAESGSRQNRKQGGNAQAAAPSPAPSVDPVWSPGAAATAPATAHGVPAGAAPVQLSPFPAPAPTAAGGTRAQ